MARRNIAWLAAVVLGIGVGVGAAPAYAAWRLTNTTTTSIAYNQGIAVDPGRDNFFFDGVTSPFTSGLYRTDSNLGLTAFNLDVIPSTTEGYNHAGDLSYDRVGRRVLLPLECYYPASGGNTCGVGAIGVADPVTLRFLYYVNLDTAQIAKAMWDEVSPDGRWIWTSSGTHLLVYRAADVNPATAGQQRAGTLSGIVGYDLGDVLPAAGVTGAAFLGDGFSHSPRLLLALNRGSYSEVVAYDTATARDGSPRLVTGTPSVVATLPQSFLNNESEGLATTSPFEASGVLGGVLHWQMLPVFTLFSLYSRILSYVPPAAGRVAGVRVRTAEHGRSRRLAIPGLNTAQVLAALRRR